ncbi:MAG: ribosome maturation factor RimP [Campylobacterales bacterium]|nr:ribosome maturation factor RimP [Campylobacterales bacterium]
MDLNESIKLAVEGCGVDLYDVVKTKEHDTDILRVFITSKDGVSLDKCAQVSRMISPILDLHEPMSDKYNLEVSSPGIERKLKSLHHFQCSVGEKAKIKEFSTEVFKGTILDVSVDGVITIEDINQGETKINFSDILSASTYFEW